MNRHLEDSDDHGWSPRRNRDSRKKQRREQRRRKDAPPSAALLATLQETADNEAVIDTTYTPSRYEAGWLLQSLQPFYEEGLITDILFHIQGGKEASVYCCAAAPDSAASHLAVKVYRPRRFRQLSNDQLYREGRETLSEEGRTIKQTNHRVMRAVKKRTDFGEKVRHVSWLMYEFNALKQLFDDGCAVPRPWSASHNAIVMDYIGTAQAPAAPLARLSLDPAEASALLDQALHSINLMLQRGLIHGDLSAYNILYQDGQLTLIDFPQIVRVGVNRHSEALFWRDVTRVCSYFRGQGVRCDPDAIAAEMWSRYVISRETDGWIAEAPM